MEGIAPAANQLSDKPKRHYYEVILEKELKEHKYCYRQGSCDQARSSLVQGLARYPYLAVTH